MALKLELRDETHVPIEVEGVTPEVLRNKSTADVERLKIFHGNQQIPLAEWFKVTGTLDEQPMVWEGDLSGVHWIGAKMSSGSVLVDGNAGRHLGSEMRGGRITVKGNAGDWVGGEMKRGVISVQGQAGHLIGAAYRGSSVGMRGGTIMIGGDAGNEIGHTMRRGLIAIGGNCGDLVGFNMLAGSLLVFGDCGIRHGAGMRRGTLAFFGSEPPPLLPSFNFSWRGRPLVMELMLRYLRQHEFCVSEELWQTDFAIFCGDMIEGGRGELMTLCHE